MSSSKSDRKLSCIQIMNRLYRKLDVGDSSETDMVKSPQRVGVVPYVPGAFGDVGIFKDGFKSLAVV